MKKKKEEQKRKKKKKDEQKQIFMLGFLDFAKGWQSF